MSRMLAAKAALAIRVDALGEDTNADMGIEHRATLERRLHDLEEGKVCTNRSKLLATSCVFSRCFFMILNVPYFEMFCFINPFPHIEGFLET